MNDRACTILQLLPKLDTGGAERVAIEISEAVAATGQTALIACNGGALVPAALRAGAEIIALPLDSKSPFTLRRNAVSLARLVTARQVSMIHAHSRAPAWSGYWAARRTGVRFVTTYHGIYNENAPFKRRYNAIMAKGERVIAVSHYVAELIARRHPAAAPRIRTIPGGVDTVKFNPAAVLGDRAVRLAQAWRLPLAAPTIMLPGRLTSWKGHSLLITALAMMRNRQAVVILAGGDQGREQYTRRLIRHAESLGVANRLRLAGNVEDMPAAMMLADIVVNASTDPEAFGRTIVEAQAMARIVVAADHGGAAETIIDHETGLLFPPGDAAALAARLDAVLEMPAEARLAFGRHSRAVVASRYSMAAMQSANLAVYAELLEAPAPLQAPSVAPMVTVTH